jgi:hypothetical protein
MGRRRGRDFLAARSIVEYRFVPKKAVPEEQPNGQPQPAPDPDPEPVQAQGDWLPPGDPGACTYETTRYHLRPLYDGFVHTHQPRFLSDPRTARKERRRREYNEKMKWQQAEPQQQAAGMVEYLNRMPSANGDHPRRDVAVRRTRIVVEMGLQGRTMSDIGRAIGVSTSAARDIFDREMKRSYRRESVARLRRLTLARLERMHTAIWPAAVGWVETTPDGEKKVHPPDLNAYDRLLRTTERIAAVGGLNITTANLNVALRGEKRAQKLNPDIAYEMMRAGAQAAARLGVDGSLALEHDPGPLDEVTEEGEPA